jgi:hypothetical protein
MELESNRKLFPHHLSSILHGALVGAGSLWPNFLLNVKGSIPVIQWQFLAQYL